MRPVEDLRPAEQAYRTAMLARCPENRVVETLAETFGRIIRRRDSAALDAPIERAEACQLREFREFAGGIRRDEALVRAALDYQWSSGQTEG